MEGLIQPAFRFTMANEKVAMTPVTYSVKPRNFTVIEAALKSEFNALIPFMASVGYKSEDTNNGQADSIAFTAVTLDAGLEASIIKKKLKAFAGYKNIAFKGNEYGLRQTTAPAPPALPSYAYSYLTYDKVISSIGVGLEYYVAKPAVIGISFSTTTVDDLRAGIDPLSGAANLTYKAYNSYNVQELDVKLSISF
jgi:hypothetical protein